MHFDTPKENGHLKHYFLLKLVDKNLCILCKNILLDYLFNYNNPTWSHYLSLYFGSQWARQCKHFYLCQILLGTFQQILLNNLKFLNFYQNYYSFWLQRLEYSQLDDFFIFYWISFKFFLKKFKILNRLCL